MLGRMPQILRTVAGTALVTLGLTSVAVAQVPPNPPTGVTIDDGTSEPPDPGSPGNPIFFDDFGYVVNKLDSAETKQRLFQAAGWGGIKDEQTRPGGASGYLSTVTTIPGYTGRMPGGSGRVLRMEGLPTSMGNVSSQPYRNQTDFYLWYGNAAGPQTNVPGNVWFQFWVFINDYGNEQSHWAPRNKLIYPSDDGTASGDGTENAYLISVRPSSQAGTYQSYGPDAYVVNKIEEGNGGQVVSNAPEGETYVGANLASSNGYHPPGRWELVKIHVDHASVNGTYEVWKRPMNGSWIKTTEWIGGRTPGFTWVTQPALRAGHNMFKIPTTWGTAKQDDPTNFDAWMYIADFAMANREADLPVYDNY